MDKSALIEELIPALAMNEKLFCITRPRRFGKTVMANMIGAFFEKAVDGSGVFESLNIAKNRDYKKHLNQHNVIYVDFSRVARDCSSYRQYIDRIQNGISKDLAEAYPELKIDSTLEEAISQIKQKNYIFRIKGKLGEEPKYTGKILAVGISYSRKTKEHFCKVEEI